MLYIWIILWKNSRTIKFDKALEVARIGQATLLTAVILAMTGEYFYGGLTWFIFLITTGVVFRANVVAYSGERKQVVPHILVKPI